MAVRAAVLFAALASPAVADFAADEYPPYERCALCHGLWGQSHMAKFPHLGGQRPAYIGAQIAAFLSGSRTNDRGQMAAIVTELKPEEIPVVIEWFSTQDPPEPSGEPSPEGAAAFADAGCATCHSNTAEAAPEVPYLTAQHAGYLAKQMTDFKAGARTGTDVAAMHQDLLTTIDATMIEAIASHLSSQARP